MDAEIVAAPGIGVPVNLTKKNITHNSLSKTPGLFTAGKEVMSRMDFLKNYKTDIENLPVSENSNLAEYYRKLDNDKKEVLLTLLPGIASLKHRNQDLEVCELFDKLKQKCIYTIDGEIGNG